LDHAVEAWLRPVRLDRRQRRQGGLVTLSTPKVNELAARDRLGSDWDDDGTTAVYLPKDVAERLLAERGWQPEYREHPRWGHHLAGWRSPNGLGFLADTQEALTIALVAENAA
jgi:hypothetical protein